GFRRDGFFERGGRQLETVFLTALREDRRAFREQYHVGIGNPERRRDDDLVARVQRRQQRVEHHLLGAAAGDNLVGRILQSVFALEFIADGFLQRRRTGDRRVFRLAAANRRNRPLTHMIGRVEIRLAGAERDDVLAGGLEFGGLGAD